MSNTLSEINIFLTKCRRKANQRLFIPYFEGRISLDGEISVLPNRSILHGSRRAALNGDLYISL